MLNVVDTGRMVLSDDHLNIFPPFLPPAPLAKWTNEVRDLVASCADSVWQTVLLVAMITPWIHFRLYKLLYKLDKDEYASYIYTNNLTQFLLCY